MDTSLVVLIAISAISSAALTFTIRHQARQPRMVGRLWGRLELAIGLFLVIAMVCTTAAQVIVRYGFSESVILPWTEEVSRLLLVWIAFWGATIVQRTDDHIAFDVAYQLLQPTAKYYIRTFGDVVTIAFLGVVAWQGWLVAESQWPIMMVTVPLSSGLYALPVPICASLMIAHTIAIVVRRRKTISLETPNMPEP